ncbi:MAG: RluA family pseudouridine synthase, partial [Gammaproteobacteria bacterium]|nr:RluA family pseudouridine synthase [Gammaproteobacteria bacterium]
MTTQVHFIKVDPQFEGQRLDNFLHTRYKELPKSRLYRIIRKGEVRVNKKRVDPDYRIQPNDLIRMPPLKDAVRVKNLPSKISHEMSDLLNSRILYEDKQLLVLNKPSGLAVHGGSGVKAGVIELLRMMRPHDKYLELAHRIDRETSGCLLIAKKPSILKIIHELFREAKAKKKYVLLVKGQWPLKLTKINEPLEGKISITTFKVIKKFEKTTLLEAFPETGRMHQIRLHAMHAGHPLVGDDKYGDKDFNDFMRA